ncbi:exosortase family protein XrtF [Tamlana sp. 2201CG12-4]|uniref:exosortase family protein XrtF n=1 Tax=Tamlana sp. 2201CG12-4 TaxID=3112582 RepID=UPI002DB80FC9|nr:exosortase family protein XrtF [Tamlana sp. 2201CG12-4]MEC3905577.1 exosortase family protein XrtF [Tamlana sp. 2201CG12-4]
MKALLVKYKSVIKFMLTFLLVYTLLSFTYKLYLKYSDGTLYYPDYFTHLVAKQSEALLGTLGYQTEVTPHPDEPSMKLITNGIYLGRIVEGCNSLSVIILFVSFIIAFSGHPKTTFFYILSGSVLIYTVNLLRIVFLIMGLLYYPEYQEILHTVIFPAIIYGMMFLLWIVWVNRFSKQKKVNA